MLTKQRIIDRKNAPTATIIVVLELKLTFGTLNKKPIIKNGTNEAIPMKASIIPPAPINTNIAAESAKNIVFKV